MNNNLAKLESDAIQRMTSGIEVRSAHTPTKPNLELLRRMLKSDSELRLLFEQLTGEELQEAFLNRVRESFPEIEDVEETARYIWDEYEQLGRGHFLVSSVTGKVVARVTSSDVYHPAPMIREDEEGGPVHLVHKDTVHLLPQIEAYFVHSVFEEARELDYLAYVQSSGVLAAGANSEFFTRAGRLSLLEKLESTLFTDSPSFLKKFLSVYPITDTLETFETFETTIEVVRPLQDLKSYSLRQNFLGSLKNGVAYRLLDQLALWFEARATDGPHLEPPCFAFAKVWGDVSVTLPTSNVYVGPGAIRIRDFKVLGMEIHGSWYIKATASLDIQVGAIRKGEPC